MRRLNSSPGSDPFSERRTDSPSSVRSTRARFALPRPVVVATHALSALIQIFERFDSDAGATAQQQVEAVLQSERAARVLQMRALRNRSVH